MKLKKYLLASALAFSCAAHAWTTITDSTDGDRLQFKEESFNVVKEDNIILLGGAFRMIVNAEPGDPSVFIIALDSCSEGNGKMLQRQHQNGQWVTVKTYYWSDSGPKIFDTIGRVLCNSALKSIKKTPSKNGKDI